MVVVLGGQGYPPTVAARVSAKIDARLVRAGPSGWSRRFCYFEDPSSLLLVVARPDDDAARLPGAKAAEDAHYALAYGLYYRAALGKALILALPVGTSQPTLWRLPWLEGTVAVYEFEYDVTTDLVSVQRSSVQSRDEVLKSARGAKMFNPPPHDLARMTEWASELVSWANSHEYLVAAHRHTGLAWKCCGRKVLDVKRSAGRLKVVGGVKGKNFRSHVIESAEPLTITDLADTRAAVEHAIGDLLRGVDPGAPEHRLQAHLARHPHLLGLNPATVRPEFPAVRAGGGRGYVDLMGLDHDDTIHLVETKLGDDVMLVLQSLDYWIWAQACSADLADVYGLQGPPVFQLDLAVVPKQQRNGTVSDYSVAQLGALGGGVRWRLLMLENASCAESYQNEGELPVVWQQSL